MRTLSVFSLLIALSALSFSGNSRAENGVTDRPADAGWPALGINRAEAPHFKLAGRWEGPGWGLVTLREISPGKFKGTYTDTFGGPGTLELEWNAGEGRYYGSWQEGKDTRIGKLSVRFDVESGTVRGAWTASKKSQINPGVPRLADLEWKRVVEEG